MTNTTTTTDPALILAGIIRQVDGKRELGADALAQAILAHSGSRWGPAATAATPEAGYELIPDNGDPEKLPRDAQVVEGKWWRPRFGCNSLATVLESVQPPKAAPWPELSELTDAKLEADFRAWFKAKYDSQYFGGIALCDAIEWGKHLLQQSAQPTTPWPELPENPPLPEGICHNTWLLGFDQGWQAARAELQRQREQAGAVVETLNWRNLCAKLLQGLDENRHEEVRYPGHLRAIMGQVRAALQNHRGLARVAPTPVFVVPEISDQLIKSLINDVILTAIQAATKQSFLGCHWDPVPTNRARLVEILQLAAEEALPREEPPMS